MSEINITVEGGTSKRLLTAGKYCDRDIVVTATGGGGSGVGQLAQAAYGSTLEGGLKFMNFVYEPGMTWAQYESSMYNAGPFGTMFYVQEDGWVYNDSLGESRICELETGAMVKGTDEMKMIPYIDAWYFDS